MVKYKCFTAECPECKANGSIQLFLNRKNEVRYARTRHYSHIDKESKQSQFTYCKINDLEALKTLLKSQGISLNTEKAIGQLGQSQAVNNHDIELTDSSLIQ